MALSIQLLGPPRVMRDGADIDPAPRGRKSWALLAYLLLAEHPPGRSQLVDLLFTDADDPLGALRWNLSELRRALGSPASVSGRDRIHLRLPEDARLDVSLLLDGGVESVLDLPGLGRELLEGVEPRAGPGFTAWVLNERRRLAVVTRNVLREGALTRIAAGDPGGAVDLTRRLLETDPFAEDAHVLLVRSFAATGDRDAAARQFKASSDILRRELGREPSAELRAALNERAVERASAGSTVPAGGRRAWQVLLEASEAALTAGAVDVGIDGLRRAEDGARGSGDADMEARAALALGIALVHSVHGRDEEGASVLHRALSIAGRAGRPDLAASAHRELGYVELLRGDYPRANAWLRTAERLADGDPAELARVFAFRGCCLANVGAYEAGDRAFRDSLAFAEKAALGRQVAWSTTFLGQSLLLRGMLDEAEETLDRANELSAAERWTAFLPCPESLRAEVWLRQGDLDRARETFEHAFALACQVDDSCWEAYGVRGLGLVQAAEGDLVTAVATLRDAGVRCMRQHDTNLWVHTYALDALCAAAVAAGDESAEAHIDELERLAGRWGMREFVVHAYLHRRDLGRDGALASARAVAEAVEGPQLEPLLQEDAPPLLDVFLGRSA